MFGKTIGLLITATVLQQNSRLGFDGQDNGVGIASGQLAARDAIQLQDKRQVGTGDPGALQPIESLARNKLSAVENYVTRFKPGEDRSTRCRLPAGEIDRIVLDALASHLRSAAQANDSTCKVEWHAQIASQTEIAETIHELPRFEQKALLIDHHAQVQVTESSIDVTFQSNGTSNCIWTPAKLMRRGNELRIALPPDGRSQDERPTDPSLVRLIAQGFAAREYVLTGKAIEPVCSYNRKHLHRLVRISWLAPDIITSILEGRQPVQLTAHHLLRCADIPMEWKEQRNFLGFN